ncbi:hypothetical protein B5F76_09210 [Desulfovibrio sp. An276]|uniref:hypothetical protein n=1 Tax=Desulfovibrio sp. An276 TaxID=1965618 RepID=UPI000B370C4F|nr:hypothetical protein [Desulfovibrio sp. An276]OUO51652.1 hypothetical protein B5F76_09210 [Desulfovibrio sp. An276]
MAMPRKKYNERDERIALSMAQYGVPHTQIAQALGMSKDILYKLYGDAMQKGAANANAKIAQCLYNKAIGNQEKGIPPDTTALIFWCKTRMGWRETQKVDLTSSDGSMSPSPAIDFSGKTQEELLELTRAAFGLEHKD